MNARFSQLLCAPMLAVACFAVSPAPAATFTFSGLSSSGHPVASSATFTPHAALDVVQVTLTNLTPNTVDAGQLFSGLDFSIGGLTPTLTSDTGIRRTVDNAGNYTDAGSAQDLSWSLVSQGSGSFQLNFNPNAADAVIGPPTANSYSGANGSIKGNAGHNPFAGEIAMFVLSVPNLEDITPIAVTAFRFGTGLAAATGAIVPEPATQSLAMIAVAWAARMRRRRRTLTRP